MMIVGFLLIVACIVVFLLILALVSYRPLPKIHRKNSQNPANPNTTLAKEIKLRTSEHLGLTGVYAFGSGQDAFAARIALIEAAERSLDLRYYIFKNDISGTLIKQRLYAAANRGVRVRLLVDDNTMAGMDDILLALDSHENIEVRLFNPFMQRRFRLLGFLSDFRRLNYRMHNKSFTADGVVSIIGGRNIGDEYFGAGDGVMFADMDVSVMGDVMESLNQDFEKYWSSDIVYPVREIIKNPTKITTIDTKPSADVATQNYIEQIKQSDYLSALTRGDMEFIWAKVTLISDEPIRSKERREDNVTAKIVAYFLDAKQTLTIISPYFIPAKWGLKILVDIAKKGIKINIITNSLAANDVAAVHSGYAKYRKPLLRAGVGLFELKPNAAPISQKKKQGIGSTYRGGGGSSLHAKTFTVDGRYMFVGSYNLDPRSALHNTEMGIVIDNPQMASAADEQILNNLSGATYELHLDKHRLRWRSKNHHTNAIIDHHKDPKATWYKRVGVWLLKWLPIEWLL